MNKFACSDPYPVPGIDGIINRIADAKMLLCFDMSQGYFQTRIRPGDEPLTAFVCDDEIFEFLRTPFGGKACGSIFICNVQKVIEPICGFTESFVDDEI